MGLAAKTGDGRRWFVVLEPVEKGGEDSQGLRVASAASITPVAVAIVSSGEPATASAKTRPGVYASPLTRDLRRGDARDKSGAVVH